MKKKKKVKKTGKKAKPTSSFKSKNLERKKKRVKKGLRISSKKIVKEPKNIVRKKEKKLLRLATGIPGFDRMVQGGFESNSINLIVGGSGSGKSIFALQFLMQGVKKGETVLYVTFEERKEEFYENMKKLGWDLAKHEKSGKFIFLEYSPEKVKMMLDEGGGTIESLVLRHKIKRLVIDSITSFSLLFEDVLSKRQANLGLFDIISKWNCTTLLPVQHNPSRKREDGELPSIEFEADSITLLHFIRLKNKRQRFIEVLKMRGTDHSKETYSFEIKNGIKIGKKTDIKHLVGG